MRHDLRDDIEQACGALKHGLPVDPYELRALLRRCQARLDEIDEALAGATVTLPGDTLARLLDQ